MEALQCIRLCRPIHPYVIAIGHTTSTILIFLESTTTQERISFNFPRPTGPRGLASSLSLLVGGYSKATYSSQRFFFCLS